LEVKYQLLLQYIANLAFIIQLKLSGKQLESHPVIQSLIELRVMLEKMKPVEQKLKYQIDKVVRTALVGEQDNEMANSGSAFATSAGTNFFVISGTETLQKDSNQHTTCTVSDPLSFKPNPMDLVGKGGDDEEGTFITRQSIKCPCAFNLSAFSFIPDESTDKSGVYKPPKLAPVTYDEDTRKSSRQEKNQSRLVEKASRSRIMRDLMAEMDDRPEEVDALGGVNEGMGFGDSLDRHIQEKDQYEENNYVRLAVTRKEKKRLQNNNRMRFDNEFDVRTLHRRISLY
jgi:U3 small nucleolar ribonucleoprotein protein LCP5